MNRGGQSEINYLTSKMVDQHTNLLACYKFSDYPVHDWLTNLWNVKLNSEYKALIAQNDTIAQLNTLCKDFSSIEELKESA